MIAPLPDELDTWLRKRFPRMIPSQYPRWVLWRYRVVPLESVVGGQSICTEMRNVLKSAYESGLTFLTTRQDSITWWDPSEYTGGTQVGGPGADSQFGIPGMEHWFQNHLAASALGTSHNLQHDQSPVALPWHRIHCIDKEYWIGQFGTFRQPRYTPYMGEAQDPDPPDGMHCIPWFLQFVGLHKTVPVYILSAAVRDMWRLFIDHHADEHSLYSIFGIRKASNVACRLVSTTAILDAILSLGDAASLPVVGGLIEPSAELSFAECIKTQDKFPSGLEQKVMRHMIVRIPYRRRGEKELSGYVAALVCLREDGASTHLRVFVRDKVRIDDEALARNLGLLVLNASSSSSRDPRAPASIRFVGGMRNLQKSTWHEMKEKALREKQRQKDLMQKRKAMEKAERGENARSKEDGSSSSSSSSSSDEDARSASDERELPGTPWCSCAAASTSSSRGEARKRPLGHDGSTIFNHDQQPPNIPIQDTVGDVKDLEWDMDDYFTAFSMADEIARQMIPLLEMPTSSTSSSTSGGAGAVVA